MSSMALVSPVVFTRQRANPGTELPTFCLDTRLRLDALGAGNRKCLDARMISESLFKLYPSTFPFQEKQQLKCTTFGFNYCGWRTWASSFIYLFIIQ